MYSTQMCILTKTIKAINVYPAIQVWPARPEWAQTRTEMMDSNSNGYGPVDPQKQRSNIKHSPKKKKKTKNLLAKHKFCFINKLFCFEGI